MRPGLLTLCVVLCLSTRANPSEIESFPNSRGGQDLVGKAMPELRFDRWLGANPPTSGRVTLYRWWTDTCPYCATSLPAIEALRRQYGPKGLEVVAVYHPKPVRKVDDSDVLAAARKIGYGGAIAIDESWSQLNKLYLETGNRGATSITVLVDERGTIRFLHPGPDLFPSTQPGEARQDADYRLLAKAVRILLGG
jgi:thiol-disulfide isomerase/thioredoxin